MYQKTIEAIKEHLNAENIPRDHPAQCLASYWHDIALYGDEQEGEIIVISSKIIVVPRTCRPAIQRDLHETQRDS